MRKNIKAMLPTSAALDDSDASSCCRARVLMAKVTPKKTTMYAPRAWMIPALTMINGSPRHLDVSDASPINDTSPDPIGSNASPIPVRSAQDRRKQFTCPKEPKKDRDEAYERTCNALDQVPDIVHFKKAGLRKTATLYVGNLAFKASEEDLSNALSQIFIKIQVEKVTIPQENGRPRGFAFVDLSWAADAPVKMIDICIAQSAMIFVNSRPIYLRELDGEADSESSDRSMGSPYAANSESSDQSTAPRYTMGEASDRIAFLRWELSRATRTIAVNNLSDSSI